MGNQSQMDTVEALLEEHGLSLSDMDEDAIQRDLDNGEDPEAIVDALVGPLPFVDGLTRVSGPFQPSQN